MTTKFCKNAYIHKVNYSPKYRPSTAHSNGNIGPIKPRFPVFRQNGGKNYPGFVSIFVFSTLNFDENANNLEILRNLGSKLKKFKN